MASQPDARSTTSILLVDDNRANLEYLEQVLIGEGYKCHCVTDVLGAISHLTNPKLVTDLVMTDIGMPITDGLDLLHTIRSVQPELPVVMISGLYDLNIAVDALRSGASDYLIKPAKPQQIIEVVGKNLQPRSHNKQVLAQTLLAKFIRERAVIKHAVDRVHEIFEVIGLKQVETQEHSRRVASYAAALGEACSLPAERAETLHLAALLHDIGKIAIPQNVLFRAGPLNDDEWGIMRLHPRIGYELLNHFSELDDTANVVYSHHERFDGSGYPRGLRGCDIPLEARLFSVVDTFDAITSNRPYRVSQSVEYGRSEIGKNKNRQFDPLIVDRFLELDVGRLEEIMQGAPH